MTLNVGLPLLVLAMPFAAFLLLAVVGPLRRTGRGAGLVSIAAIAISFAAALTVWAQGFVAERTWAWIPADGGPIATVGVLVDPLTNPMLVLVTLVSLLVQIYSLAYLSDERPAPLGRYYTYQSLFVFSMLGLVLAPGFLQMFVFWELVGSLLVSFDRLLVRAPGGRARGGEGVLDHEARRRRLHRRYRAPVVGHRDVRVHGALRESAGQRARRSGPRDDHVPDLSRRRRQVGPVPAPRVASRRDGGADAGLGAHPRRDDGHRRRLHGDPDRAAVRAGPRGPDPDRLGGRVHRAAGRDDGVRRGRHQACARVLDHLAARLHDGGRGSRRRRPRASCTCSRTGSSRRSCSSPPAR